MPSSSQKPDSFLAHQIMRTEADPDVLQATVPGYKHIDMQTTPCPPKKKQTTTKQPPNPIHSIEAGTQHPSSTAGNFIHLSTFYSLQTRHRAGCICPPQPWWQDSCSTRLQLCLAALSLHQLTLGTQRSPRAHPTEVSRGGRR